VVKNKTIRKHRFMEIPNKLSMEFCNKYIRRWKESPSGEVKICTEEDPWGCSKIIICRTIDGWVRVRNSNEDWNTRLWGANEWVGYFNLGDIKWGLKV
jgi:hypothetical protein